MQHVEVWNSEQLTTGQEGVATTIIEKKLKLNERQLVAVEDNVAKNVSSAPVGCSRYIDCTSQGFSTSNYKLVEVVLAPQIDF